MKKYADYLTEQYTPLTRDELTKYEEVVNTVLDGVRTNPDHRTGGAVGMQTFSQRLLDEIEFLRAQMVTAYEYIGRRAPVPATRRYSTVMREATRIRQEDSTC